MDHYPGKKRKGLGTVVKCCQTVTMATQGTRGLPHLLQVSGSAHGSFVDSGTNWAHHQMEFTQTMKVRHPWAGPLLNSHILPTKPRGSN